MKSPEATKVLKALEERYLAWSQREDPTFEPGTPVQIETTVEPVTAHDGETIYVEITRPKGATDLPVILEASPYHGTIADRKGTRMFPDPVDAEGNLLGLTGYFPQRGYAVAMMDLRGTGRSTGCHLHWMVVQDGTYKNPRFFV